MIKTIRLLCGFMAIAMMTFVTSCEDDSPPIDGGGSIPVANGFYITQEGVNPVSTSQLVAEIVEGDGIGVTQTREGFYSGYVFLPAGNYQVVSVVDQELGVVYGGTAAVETNATEENPDGTGSDCELFEYTLVEEYVEGGASFAVSAGLYKVGFDLETKEIWLYEIEKAQVIGAASAAGWSSSEDQDMAVVGTISADGATFKIEDITLRPGEFKIRFNCRWIIDRRIEGDSHAFENGYAAFTNFGGTVDLLVPGGANFVIALDEDGLYDVSVAWTAAAGFDATITKTESIDPIVFDPANYDWGIIGTGSPVGNWDSDISLVYDGVGANGHSWVGTFALTADAFKFRADDGWVLAPNASTYAAVTGDGAVDINATGNDFVCTTPGTHLITISTNDAGVTWAIDFDKQ